DSVGAVTDFAQMQYVNIGVVVRTGGDRRPAKHGHLTLPMGATVDIVDAIALHMHAAYENRISPGEVSVACRFVILIDEAHLPFLRKVGCDQKQALGWHERADKRE